MELTRDDVFAAVYRGIPIECTEAQYPQVRTWLRECIDFWQAPGTEAAGLKAFIAHNEIKRLDQLFEVH